MPGASKMSLRFILVEGKGTASGIRLANLLMFLIVAKSLSKTMWNWGEMWCVVGWKTKWTEVACTREGLR